MGGNTLQQTYAGGQLYRGDLQGARNANRPTQPGITNHLQDLHGYLNEIESMHSQILDRLIGPRPESVPNNKGLAQEPPIHERLLAAVQRAAASANEARQILDKL